MRNSELPPGPARADGLRILHVVALSELRGAEDFAEELEIHQEVEGR